MSYVENPKSSGYYDFEDHSVEMIKICDTCNKYDDSIIDDDIKLGTHICRDCASINENAEAEYLEMLYSLHDFQND